MKRIGIFLLALSVAAPLSAQRYDVGGSVIDMNGITALDMFNYSQTSHNFGTARSMAMAGALTSLGGRHGIDVDKPCRTGHVPYE